MPIVNEVIDEVTHWSDRVRLGLRLDPKVFERLDDHVHALKQQARKDGTELPSKDSVVGEAITFYLDSLEGKRR